MGHSSSQHKYILVLVDYATWYPEAVALKNMRVDTVAKKLAHTFARIGFPKQVVTDQGTSFMKEMLQAFWLYVGV